MIFILQHFHQGNDHGTPVSDDNYGVGNNEDDFGFFEEETVEPDDYLGLNDNDDW